MTLRSWVSICFWTCCVGVFVDAVLALACLKFQVLHQFAGLYLECGACFAAGAAANYLWLRRQS